MRRHTVYVALTFEVDDGALGPGDPAGVPDVELVQHLVDAVAVDRLARAGVRLVSPARSVDPSACDADDASGDAQRHTVRNGPAAPERAL